MDDIYSRPEEKGGSFEVSLSDVEELAGWTHTFHVFCLLSCSNTTFVTFYYMGLRTSINVLSCSIWLKCLVACHIKVIFKILRGSQHEASTALITASIPVLKLLLITGLGAYLARDGIDILEEDARKHLNTVVFYVFSPALVASNLAQTITSKSMVKMWFMPINILITFIIGSILGWIVILVTRAPPHLRGLILGCCAADRIHFMWSYVYNIIRTSSRRSTKGSEVNEISISMPLKEPSTVDLGSCIEPLPSSTKDMIAEDNEDH